MESNSGFIHVYNIESILENYSYTFRLAIIFLYT